MVDSNLSDVILDKIYAISRVNIVPGRKYYRYNRERDAISIKTTGKTTFTSAGKKYVADSAHVLLLPQGVSYEVFCPEKGESLMIDFESNICSVFPEVKAFNVSTQTELKNIFSEMERSWHFKKPAYNFKCLAGLYDIIAKLIESEQLNREVNSKYYIIKPALDYLENNYNDPALSIAELSERAGVSAVYFRKIFTGILRMPPLQYIQAVRISKAKDMLVSNYNSIGDIAESVGFASIYHFSKTFKKATGCSPSAFSRRYAGHKRGAK